MTILLPVLAIILGGLAYCLVDKYPKIAELGRITFAFGMLVFLLNSANWVAALIER